MALVFSAEAVVTSIVINVPGISMSSRIYVSAFIATASTVMPFSGAPRLPISLPELSSTSCKSGR